MYDNQIAEYILNHFNVIIVPLDTDVFFIKHYRNAN